MGDLKTRYIPGEIHQTATTFRKRREKTKRENQHTLNIENVACRTFMELPPTICVHPPNKPTTTYKITNAPPDRKFCEVERTRFHGEALVHDKFNEWWERGEYWNRDSNIKRWNFQEIRRNAAQGAHDIHRHEQVNHETLAADRDNPVNLFRRWYNPPVNDMYDPKPGAASASMGVHNQRSRSCDEYKYCFDGDGVRPQAIYTRKFRAIGEAAFRERGRWII